jgi:hypothetical protein
VIIRHVPRPEEIMAGRGLDRDTMESPKDASLSMRVVARDPEYLSFANHLRRFKVLLQIGRDGVRRRRVFLFVVMPQCRRSCG